MKKILLFYFLIVVIFSYQQVSAFGSFDYQNFFQNFGLNSFLRNINFGENIYRPVTRITSLVISTPSTSSPNLNEENVFLHIDNNDTNRNYSPTTFNPRALEENKITPNFAPQTTLERLLSSLSPNTSSGTTPQITGLQQSEPVSNTYGLFATTTTNSSVQELRRVDQTGIVQPSSVPNVDASPASGGLLPSDINFSLQTAIQAAFRNFPATGPVNPAIWDGNPLTRPNQLLASTSLIEMNRPTFRVALGSSTDVINSLQDGRFTILPDNWLKTKATNFGLTVNGGADTGLVNFALGCPTSMSGFSRGGVRVCNQSTCVVGIPPDVMDYYFGKTTWNRPRWAPYPAGENAQSILTLYRRIAGTPIEIINERNNRCTVVPLWETGPSKSECAGKGCGIDLTYCVKVVLLENREGRTPVRYRPVPQGKRGCEGFQYIQAPVNTLPERR